MAHRPGQVRPPRLARLVAEGLIVALMIGVGRPGLAAASAPVAGATCGPETTTVTFPASLEVGPPFVEQVRHVAVGRISVLWFNELGTTDPAGTIKQVDIAVRGAGGNTYATPPGAVLLGIWYFDRRGNLIGNGFVACG
jgi:hypothetical protein